MYTILPPTLAERKPLRRLMAEPWRRLMSDYEVTLVNDNSTWLPKHEKGMTLC